MESNNARQPMVSSSDGQTHGSLSRRILLAEDDLACQKLAVCVLTKAGYSVELAENGKHVIEKVQQDSYDLILMDMQMPITDGIVATMTIRQLGYRTIPIIGLTANAFKKDHDRCLAAGMNDYVSKPVAPSALLEKIKHWIHKSMETLSTPK
jgi:two-component system sensor histidine kinase/response regulator